MASKNGGGCGKIVQVKVTVDAIMLMATVESRFELPWVSDVSPSNAPTTGHSNIIIYGRNLGIHETSPSLSFCGSPNLFTTWISDSTVQSLVPR
jgi:hypothetical protein